MVTFESHARGDIILRQGDPGDRFYIIAHGKLDVMVSAASKEAPPLAGPSAAALSGDGEAGGAEGGSEDMAVTIEPQGGGGAASQQAAAAPGGEGDDSETFATVASLQKGDVFGEGALLSDGPRSASLVCRLKTDVLSVAKADFSRILQPLFTVSFRDKFTFLRRLRALASVGDRPLATLARLLGLSHVQAGTIFHPEQDNRMYFCVEGELRLTLDGGPTAATHARADYAGHAHGHGHSHGHGHGHTSQELFYSSNTISRLGPGAFFGECALFPETTSDWLVECHTDCRLLFVSSAEFHQFVAPEVARVLREQAEFKLEYYAGRSQGRGKHHHTPTRGGGRP